MSVPFLLRRALALCFARPCQACGGRVDDVALGTACHGCWQQLGAEALPEVSTPALAQPAFDRALGAFAYGGLLKELLHAYKFEGHPSLKRPLGRSLSERCAAAADWACELVVPVPGSSQGLSERGYQPAAQLAAALAGSWGLRLNEALAWARPHQRQGSLGLEERLTNAQGSLRASSAVAGKRVLLVDDILSSGATAHEAARALRAAGAVFVGVAALAHAEARI